MHAASVDTDRRIIVVPWIESAEDLKNELTRLSRDEDDRPSTDYDLIIHAPIDGVLAGLHGVDPKWLASLGFNRVLAGHYHNHKEFEGSVYSIGPIAHHSWSDVGSRAGFLIVHEDRVQWFKSHCPDFVDITPDMDEPAMALAADGNYVRVKTHSTKTSELNALRSFFEKAGAKGIVLQHVKEATATRPSGEKASIEVGASLEKSVSSFVHESGLFTERGHAEKVNKAAQMVLAEAA
jgi:hypothetical protein